MIDGPAGLAGLDVTEVREAIIDQAHGEPGALPLVENALDWLWQRRENGRLSGRLFTKQGGLAGLLSRSADDLLDGLGPQQSRALELLFRLVKVDPEGVRHARQRIPRNEAVAIAGGGEAGLGVVNRLSGQRRPDGGKQAGPLRLVTITGGTARNDGASGNAWVALIHETLIRSKGLDAAGKPQPYWPTLWEYIEKNKERAARRERLHLMAREWKDRKGLTRLFGLAGWSSLLGFRGLAAPGSLERRYLCWSRARAVVEVGALVSTLAVISESVESVSWAVDRGAPFAAIMERWSYTLGLAKPPFPPLVEIPAGSFQMGSGGASSTRPVHPVTFARPFSLGATEVTSREWDACVADGGCDYRPADQVWGRETPVINVSWQDTQAYVVWLSGKLRAICRLPSEAEWEYAAGREWEGQQTAPVTGAGKLRLNRWWGFGHDDWEWVEDCWHQDYEGAPGDGLAWQDQDAVECSSRVVRGGSLAVVRNGATPYKRNLGVGFRVVCSPILGH